MTLHDPPRLAPSQSAVAVPAPANVLPLADLNAAFESASAEKIVEWSAAQFDAGLVMSSSFGADSAVLLHMATRVVRNLHIIFVDTGYLFPETHAFMELLRKRLALNVWTYRTSRDPFDYLAEAGEGATNWRNDIDSCCAANKNEPFERAMTELRPSAWLRGVRRQQSASRSATQTIEWSARYNCYAVSPLVSWHSRDIHAYLKLHELPYHPLVEKGYLSIGCKPLSCTRPVTADDDPRAGRWAASNKVECGINLTNSLESSGL